MHGCPTVWERGADGREEVLKMRVQSTMRSIAVFFYGLCKTASGFLASPVGGGVFSVVIVIFSIAFYITNAFGALDIRVRNSLEDYQWGELKLLSNMIGSAVNDEEGIEIARRFNLCREDGTIDPEDTKLMEFADGSGSQQFRIIGFRHDMLTSRDVMAGITFCFCGSVGATSADVVNGDAGGWPASDLRTYAEDFVTKPASFHDKLPVELGRSVVRVRKASWDGDGIADTEDILFALSCEEVFGAPKGEGLEMLPPSGSEGYQYRFFAQNGGEDLRAFLESCEGGFWLRSVPRGNESAFFVAGGDSGDASPQSSDASANVVLAFCL